MFISVIFVLFVSCAENPSRFEEFSLSWNLWQVPANLGQGNPDAGAETPSKTHAHLFAKGASLCASLAMVAQRDIHRTFCAILPYYCPGRLVVSADYVGIEKSLSRGQDTSERAS